MTLKRILMAVPVVVVVVLSLVFTGGCSSEESTTSAVGMMEQLPKGGDGFVFADIKGMQDNEDLKDLYDTYKDEAAGDMEDMAGISPDDVTAVAFSVSIGTYGPEVVYIVKGKFNLGDVRDALKGSDFEEDDKYEGVEIWKSSGEYSEDTVALVDDSLIIYGATLSDVKDCIDVIKGDGSSLEENTNLKDIMDRLPSSIAVSCAEVPSSYSAYIENFTSSYGYIYLNGLELAGLSLGVEDENLVLTAVLKFGNESDADDANDKIKGDIEDAIDNYLGGYIEASDVEVNVSQDGVYVKVTAKMSTETLTSAIEEAMGG